MQLTHNQGVPGSSPGGTTGIKRRSVCIIQACFIFINSTEPADVVQMPVRQTVHPAFRRLGEASNFIEYITVCASGYGGLH